MKMQKNIGIIINFCIDIQIPCTALLDNGVGGAVLTIDNQVEIQVFLPAPPTTFSCIQNNYLLFLKMTSGLLIPEYFWNNFLEHIF